MNAPSRLASPALASGGTVLLAARGLGKSFGAIVAVGAVDFDIPEHCFVTLLGPSGCGKTTILRMIAGFEAPTGGSLRLNGVPIEALPPERRPVNTVFQNYALFPHLTVEENVGFSLRLRRTPKNVASDKVRRALDVVHMAGFAARYPNELSGGQQQRVAVARAIVAEPKLLLLDEPLSALDRRMREHLQGELKSLQRRLGISFVYVTHDQEEAFALSDLIIVMNAGAIVQTGPPEAIYARPESAFVAEFIGTSALVPGAIASTSPGRAVIETRLGAVGSPAAAGLEPGDAAFLAIRPEALAVGDPAGTLRCRVTGNTFQGGRTLTEFDCHGIALRAWSEAPLPLAAEQPVRLLADKAWITR